MECSGDTIALVKKLEKQKQDKCVQIWENIRRLYIDNVDKFSKFWQGYSES